MINQHTIKTKTRTSSLTLTRRIRCRRVQSCICRLHQENLNQTSKKCPSAIHKTVKSMSHHQMSETTRKPRNVSKWSLSLKSPKEFKLWTLPLKKLIRFQLCRARKNSTKESLSIGKGLDKELTSLSLLSPWTGNQTRARMSLIQMIPKIQSRNSSDKYAESRITP